MNRKLYLIIIGIVEVLFFIYTIVLYRRGTIDTSDLQSACIYMAFAAVMSLALAFVKPSWMVKKKEDLPAPVLNEVPRTREGTIFEVLTGLILAAAWIVAIAGNRFWVIEGYFSFIGAILMFLLTVIAITFLWSVYLPGYQSRLSNFTSVKQAALDIRMWRLIAVGIALLVLMYDIPLDYSRPEYLYILAGLILITIATFRYLSYKAR